MKLKKWLPALAAFAAMVVLCAVCAGAETYGDLEYSVLDDGTITEARKRLIFRRRLTGRA